MAKTVALYGGGFKPPTKGHVEVVTTALKELPNVDEFIIFVGGGERDGIDQTESLLVWEIYENYLPQNVKIQPSKAPIGDILRYAKDHPDETVYFVLGARDDYESDLADIQSRTRNVKEKYPNIDIKVINTSGAGMSGTNARKALTKSEEDFYKYLPDFLKQEDRKEIYKILSPKPLSEMLNENATYSKDIDFKQYIKELTKNMIKQGKNITPLPKVIFKNGDQENAKDFLGKTAYYIPETMTIVLYTEGRHPKDIVRSFAHEMVHHIQNLEGRLGNISTTNTTEDDNLQDIEKEAYLDGNITFRNWTDSLLNEIRKNKDPFGISQFSRELAQGLEEEETPQYVIYSDMDGVLTDFDKRFEQYSGGVRPSEYEKNLGKAGFWDLITKQGVKFWVGMEWMPDGKQYWNYIKKYNPILLSAPSREESSRLGKRLWVKNNMPGTKLVLAYASDKKNYAKPNAILIDDRPDNIKQWQDAGGIGILHISADNTISQLKKLGL